MELPYKHLFPRAQEVTYLDTAAEGLPAPGCSEAFQQYCGDKRAGTPGRKALFQAEGEALELAACLLGTDRTNVAFLSSASEALYVLSSSLHWSSGDEVIISDTEFPSNIFPWLRLRQHGIRVIVIPADAGVVGWERVAAQISPRTRLVSLSLVSYKTGAYLTGLPALVFRYKCFRRRSFRALYTEAGSGVPLGRDAEFSVPICVAREPPNGSGCLGRSDIPGAWAGSKASSSWL
jgi:hypothetical protein